MLTQLRASSTPHKLQILGFEPHVSNKRRPSSPGQRGRGTDLLHLAFLLSPAAQTRTRGGDQRAALLEHMRKNGLKVADVLRLCASVLDDSERI